MGFGLKRIADPAAEPLTTDEAKAWLRVEVAEDNTLIDELVKDARERFERIAAYQLITATWQLTLDGFPGERASGEPVGGIMDDRRIYVPMPRLQSVSSIQYVDTAGATQTLAATEYRVDTASEPARIEPAYGKIWPTTREVVNAVTITYVAGYGMAGSAVPASVKVVLRRMAALLYDFRGLDKDSEALEGVIECLCRPFWHGHLF